MIDYIIERIELSNEIRENVIVAGRNCGEIWKTESGYQCQFLVSRVLGNTNRSLSLNGCGKTKIDAMKNAIDAGRIDAYDLKHAADFLEKHMEGGDE
jgi:hypothetical protein